MHCIYRVTNNINGHTYIGQHFYGDKANPLQMATKRGLYKGSGKILKIAYKKYGISNFSIKILHEKIESLDMTNKLERYWISYERLCGHAEYNIADGGQGAAYCRGHWFSERVKEGMKRSGAGKKISMSMTGAKNPMYGKPAVNRGIPPTDEAREKNRQAHLGKKSTEETRRKQSEWMKAHPNSGQFKKGHISNNKGKVYYKDPNSMKCDLFFEGQQPSGWIRGRYTPWQGDK